MARLAAVLAARVAFSVFAFKVSKPTRALSAFVAAVFAFVAAAVALVVAAFASFVAVMAFAVAVYWPLTWPPRRSAWRCWHWRPPYWPP